MQENTLSVLSRRIYRGAKEDFLVGLSCSVVNDDEKTLTPGTSNWNGKFSVHDIINLTKLVHTDGRETVYDLLTEKHAAKQHHIDADDILQVEDNSSASDAIAFVRRRFPVETLKNKLKKECDLVLRPERCATGWKIRPDRLLACLQFVYPWLQVK